MGVWLIISWLQSKYVVLMGDWDDGVQTGPAIHELVQWEDPQNSLLALKYLCQQETLSFHHYSYILIK